MDITENEDRITIKAELAGMKAEDVNVSISNGQLSITGEKKYEKEDKEEKYHRIERSYGKFTRSWPIPDNVEPSNISGKFEDGVLKVTLPKSETTEVVHNVPIES